MKNNKINNGVSINNNNYDEIFIKHEPLVYTSARHAVLKKEEKG